MRTVTVILHMLQRSILAVLILLLLFLNVVPCQANSQDIPLKKVLVFNSYHQGYKWSDDIMSGIVSVLGSNTKLQFEYMDTQRIADAGYLLKLSEVYSYKFRRQHFDAIIAADDPAYNFLLKYRHKLFSETPLIFCGVNFFVDSMLKGQKNVTGVIEAQDIRSTLELALRLHPKTREIYVVNDSSITGRAIAKDLEKVIPLFRKRVRFVSLSELDMERLEQKVAQLPSDSLVLYLIFFEDSNGRRFSYNEGISRIARHSRVPIYGVWDFSLGYGIVGGMLTSGFYQGERAALLTKRVLSGESATRIPVVRQGSNRYMFDSPQLKRFNIKFSQLPPDSVVINESFAGRKQVLVINSYHYGMNWTDGVDSGISSHLGNKENIDLYFEFMDTKRNSDPEYLQRIYQLYRYKFRGRRFDLVITSDDDAYNLVRKHHSELFPHVPIVFCGVNYFQPEDIKNDRLITGVVESVDMRKNLDLLLKIHPGTRRIVVINDLTATGRSNRKQLDRARGDLSGVEFDFFEDMNMSEIEERVARLPVNSVIFLLSFNRDKSGNVFSYEEAIHRIAARAKVPIYGVWDFYLGNGIVGGILSNGYSQGEMAGRIGVRILKGENAEQIPVELDSPNRYMFDYRYLKQHGINPATLPSDSTIINRPNAMIEKYGRSAAVTLFLVVAVAVYMLYRRKKAADQLRLLAATDPLTGFSNRRAGVAYLKQLIKSSNLLKVTFTLCFIDLDGLKAVNDTQGHLEGDRYLREACRVLQRRTRKGDLLCRYGGDEFIIAISNCDFRQALQYWEKIEEEIQLFNQSGEAAFKISMSRGFAVYDPAAPMTVAELVAEADAEMYRFKQQRKAMAGCP